jgi:hypothetical protein
MFALTAPALGAKAAANEGACHGMHAYAYTGIEVLNVKVGVYILLIFATLPECSQNQTAVSDTLRLLSNSNTTRVVQQQ